tara:strand:+ start:275 stop:385 length:111 start_codon:yes stop_codon:yes gene_type:complete
MSNAPDAIINAGMQKRDKNLATEMMLAEDIEIEDMR